MRRKPGKYRRDQGGRWHDSRKGHCPRTRRTRAYDSDPSSLSPEHDPSSNSQRYLRDLYPNMPRTCQSSGDGCSQTWRREGHVTGASGKWRTLVAESR